MKRVDLKPLSVNKAWKGRKYKTDIYKQYEYDLLFLLPNYKIPEGKLQINFTWGFSNRLSDADNPCKPTMDILQKKYSFNDSRVYKIVLEKVIVPKGSEFIEFKINSYGDNTDYE